MGFLQRSKSAAITERRSRSKDPIPALPTQAAGSADEEKRSTSYERPKTSTSFSRPRTANAAIGRSTDWEHPSFKIDIKAENELFSFPMPSPLLHPTKSATGKRIPSPLKELGSPAIGVAIGSPSQARPTFDRSITADHVFPRMPAQPPPARPAPTIPDVPTVHAVPTIPTVPNHPDLELEWTTTKKKRKSTWKAIGGLFCRQSTFIPPEEPLYKLKMPNAIEERDIIIPDIAELPERGTTPSYQRSPSLARGQARFEARAEADRASLMPDGQTKILRSPPVIQKDSFSPMFRSINGIPDSEPWTDDPRKDSPLSMISSHSFRAAEPKALIVLDALAPHLDLDLPDPKFERYSIMFEKLLDGPGPSLLERRQSKLKRGHSVKKLDLAPDQPPLPRLEVNGVLQRSATSPGLSLSRSLSNRIGTALSPVVEIFNRPRPIRRSKTAPSAVASPLRQTFAAAAAARNPRIEVSDTTSPTQAQPPASASHISDFDLPPTPMTITTFSDSGSVDPHDLDTVRRSLLDAEPGWDMVSTTIACNDDDESAALRAEKSPVVQVSVAKQVSVVGGNVAVRDPVRDSACSGEGKRPPMRARMIELSKGSRTSTAVLIEIAE